MRCSLLPSSAPALIVLLLVLLLSMHAVTPVSADLALAATTTFVPITSFSRLVSACAAVATNSTPEAMYSTGVKEYVNEYMSANKATEAYVAAYFTAGVGWYWQVTQLGVTSTLSVSAEDFVGGVLPDGSSGTYALYSATTQKLQAVDGKTDYKVLCLVERTYAKKKGFPWWAILIIVLGSVVIIAVVVVIVVCCCCCKKTKKYTDDEDESSFGSRSGSFSSRGTSHSGSSYTGTGTSSSTFSSRGSSYSGTSKSSGVTGSTTSSDSHSNASSSSSAASGSRSGSSSTGTSRSSASSSSASTRSDRAF